MGERESQHSTGSERAVGRDTWVFVICVPKEAVACVAVLFRVIPIGPIRPCSLLVEYCFVFCLVLRKFVLSIENFNICAKVQYVLIRGSKVLRVCSV